MASKRQIEANRANAKRSTGPKSVAGKAASSQNGRRHGLTVASKAMDEHAERLFNAVEDLLGQRIQGEETVAASAQINLWRIRNARTEMLQAFLDEPSLASMKRIMNLERYERAARARQRRVLKSLKTSER
jgi:hypothetical protein